MRLFDVGHRPNSDDWYTPPAFFEPLGLWFDLDVCAPPGGVPWVPATRWYDINDDGLSQPWEGTVWCNPPYSSPSAWLDRMRKHGDGLILVRADLSSGAYFRAWQDASSMLVPDGRLQFVPGGDQEPSSVTFTTLALGFGWKVDRAVLRAGGRRLLKD